MLNALNNSDSVKSRSAGSKILITGGAGFIGSHLCDRFIAEGYAVLCVDNFLSGSRANIEHLMNHPRFTLLEHDVCQPLPENLGEIGAILHFASPASPNPHTPVSYINHPIETLMVNTLGSQRLLELAHHNHCQIIFASTSEVYGNPAVHPQPETYWGNVSPNGERSCYDEGKRAMEALAFSYYRLGGTKIKVIRIFNTYGPRMRLDDGRFIPTLVDSIVNQKPFIRFGDGNSTRSFCYIDDLVAGIMAVFGSDSAVGEVINLGNPDEFTVNAAIKTAEKTLGAKLTVKEQPALPDDPKRRCPDISKASKILKWKPKVAFIDGIKKMVEFYRRG